VKNLKEKYNYFGNYLFSDYAFEGVLKATNLIVNLLAFNVSLNSVSRLTRAFKAASYTGALLRPKRAKASISSFERSLTS